MKLVRKFALSIIDRAVAVNPYVLARRIVALVVAIYVATWFARSGFGSYFIGDHEPTQIHFWHGPLVVISAYGAATLVYANSVVIGWAKRQFAVNAPLIVILAGAGPYVFAVAAVAVVWAWWALPVWLAFQALSLVALIARPALERVRMALTPPIADVILLAHRRR